VGLWFLRGLYKFKFKKIVQLCSEPQPPVPSLISCRWTPRLLEKFTPKSPVPKSWLYRCYIYYYIFYYVHARTCITRRYYGMDIMRKTLTRKSQQCVYYQRTITLLADDTGFLYFPSNINNNYCRSRVGGLAGVGRVSFSTRRLAAEGSWYRLYYILIYNNNI